MKYRGFIITSCIDNYIEHEDGNGVDQICSGYYCQVYSTDDDLHENQIDDFFLAEGYKIKDMSDDALNVGIAKRVDDMYNLYTAEKKSIQAKRNKELIGRALEWIGETASGCELYNTFSEVLGFSDDEIRELGYISLVEYFDRDKYAKTIADYLIDEGTENTTSGNMHFSFDEINRRFGVSLPEDADMLENIAYSLMDGENSLVVSDVITDSDIDVMFYTMYCPNVADDMEYEPDEELCQSM